MASFLDENKRKYQSYSRALNSGYDSYSSPVSSAVKSRDSYDLKIGDEGFDDWYRDAVRRSYESHLNDGRRGMLDRTFDALLLPNYAIAGFAKGLVDGSGEDSVTPWQGAWEGVKAANPFGKGYRQGETTFSNVLEEAGWKPDTAFGKFMKGAAGFVLDVALDPTTYMTFGVSGLVKGTGIAGARMLAKGAAEKIALKEGISLPSDFTRIGDEVYNATVNKYKGTSINPQLIEKLAQKKKLDADKIVQDSMTPMTIDRAKEIMKKTAGPVSSEQFEKDARNFTREYNRLFGLGREGSDVTFGLRNVPFGDKLTSRNPVTLIRDATVRRIGDKTIAPLYTKLRNAYFGGRIGRMFDTDSTLFTLAAKDPVAVYDMVRYVDSVKGMKLEKTKAEQLIRNHIKRFDLTPAEEKEVITLLEDNRNWMRITQTLRLADTDEAMSMRMDLEEEQSRIKGELLDLQEQRSRMSGELNAKQAELQTSAGDVNDYQRRLMDMDMQYASDVKDIEQHTKMLRDELERVRSAKAVREAEVAEKNRMEVEAFMKERDEALGKVERDKQKELEDSTIPTDKFNEELKQIKELKRRRDKWGKVYEKTKKRLADELKNMERGARQANKLRNEEILMRLRQDAPSYTNEKARLIDSISTVIYGRPGFLSTNMYDESMERLVDMINKNKDKDYIRGFIENNEEMFTRLGIEKYSRIANELGYDSWEKFYKKPMREMVAKMLRKGGGKKLDATALTDEEHRLYAYLEDMRAKREMLIEKYDGWTMDDFMKLKEDEANSELFGVLRDEHLFNTTGRSARSREEEFRNRAYDSPSATQRPYSAGELVDEVGIRRDELGYEQYVQGVENYRFTKQQLTQMNRVDYREARAFVAKEVSKLDLSEIEAFKDVDWITTPGKNKTWNTMANNTMRELMEKYLPESLESARAPFSLLNKEERAEVAKRAVRNLFIRDGWMGYNVKHAEDIKRKSLETLTGIYQGRVVEGSKARATIDGKVVGARIMSVDGDALVIKLKNGDVTTIQRSQVNSAVPPKIADVEEIYIKNVEEVSGKLNEAMNKLRDVKTAYAKERAEVLRKADETLKRNANTLKQLEDETATLREALSTRSPNHKSIREKQIRLKRIEEALRNEEGLEAYMRYAFGTEAIHAIEERSRINMPAMIYLDMRTDLSEKVKDIAKFLRDEFREMGAKEVGIGKLKKEQFEEMVDRYIPHILTADGQRYLNAIRANEPLPELPPGLTKDLGYGRKFNNFSQRRTTNGMTIDEVNEYYRTALEGKNFFSESLAEIYMARAMKHTELMYDNKYMRTMLEEFGKPIERGDKFRIEEGYTAVMNYGMVKEFLHQRAMGALTKTLSDEATGFAKDHLRVAWREIQQTAFENVKRDMSRKAKDYIMTQRLSGVKGEIELPPITPEQWRKMQDDEIARLIATGERSEPELPPLKGRESEEISGMYDRFYKDAMDELGLSESKITTYKKPLVDFTPEQAKKIVDLVPDAQIKQVNNAIVEKANRAREFQIKRDENDLLALFDKLTHLIKLNMTTVSPAFHARNKLSNMYLNWLNIGRDAFDVRLQKKAFDVVRNMGQSVDKTFLTIRGADGIDVMGWDEVYAQAKALGVIDEGFFAKDIGATSRTGGVLKNTSVPRKFDPTDSENFFLYRAGGAVGNLIENTDRLVHFVALLRKGVEPEDAARQVREFLFDYSDLTAFEQNVMKRIIPFYTWLRKNGELQVRTLLDNPNKMTYVAHTLAGIEGMNNEEDMIDPRYISDFAMDWVQTPFSHINAQGNREPILWSPNLPFGDLSRLPDPFNIDESLRNFFTQTNALVKVPIEQWINKNVFFGSEIANPDDTAGEQAIDRAGHVLSHNALFTIGKGLAKEDPLDAGLAAASTATGIKFATYDVEGYKQRLMQGEGQDEDPIDDAIKEWKGKLVEGFKSTLTRASDLIADTVNRNRPLDPGQYTGALAPISKATYDKLPNHEKVKYTPPTNEEATAFSREAMRITQEAYQNASGVNRFLWSLMDVTGMTNHEAYMVGRVEEVTDGDTFKVRIGDKVESVRMLLVDTPETVDPDIDYEMPYGKEASDASKKALFGKDVRLVLDGTYKDDYGRVLAYVEVGGQDWNAELLERGLAQTRYRFLPNYQREREYDRIEREASRNNVGLWGIEGYATPTEDDGYDMYADAVRRYLERNR